MEYLDGEPHSNSIKHDFRHKIQPERLHLLVLYPLTFVNNFCLHHRAIPNGNVSLWHLEFFISPSQEIKRIKSNALALLSREQ